MTLSTAARTTHDDAPAVTDAVVRRRSSRCSGRVEWRPRRRRPARCRPSSAVVIRWIRERDQRADDAGRDEISGPASSMSTPSSSGTPASVNEYAWRRNSTFIRNELGRRRTAAPGRRRATAAGDVRRRAAARSCGDRRRGSSPVAASTMLASEQVHGRGRQAAAIDRLSPSRRRTSARTVTSGPTPAGRRPAGRGPAGRVPVGIAPACRATSARTPPGRLDAVAGRRPAVAGPAARPATGRPTRRCRVEDAPPTRPPGSTGCPGRRPRRTARRRRRRPGRLPPRAASIEPCPVEAGKVWVDGRHRYPRARCHELAAAPLAAHRAGDVELAGAGRLRSPATGVARVDQQRP